MALSSTIDEYDDGIQSTPSEGVQDVPDTICAGGGCEDTIVTTIMVLNATCLFEATGRNYKEFHELVRVTEYLQ